MITFNIMLQYLSRVYIVVNASVFKQVWGVTLSIVTIVTIIGSLTNGHWAHIPLDLTINHSSTC